VCPKNAEKYACPKNVCGPGFSDITTWVKILSKTNGKPGIPIPGQYVPFEHHVRNRNKDFIHPNFHDKSEIDFGTKTN